MQSAVSAVENRIGRLLTVRRLDVEATPVGKAEAIRLGLGFFDQERYWESHEALESSWRSVEGNEKETLHAIILLAASLVHLQKDEPEVALSIMKRASEILSSLQGSYAGIDLDQLKAVVNRMVAEHAPVFFKIPVACDG